MHLHRACVPMFSNCSFYIGSQEFVNQLSTSWFCYFLFWQIVHIPEVLLWVLCCSHVSYAWAGDGWVKIFCMDEKYQEIKCWHTPLVSVSCFKDVSTFQFHCSDTLFCYVTKSCISPLEKSQIHKAKNEGFENWFSLSKGRCCFAVSFWRTNFLGA